MTFTAPLMLLANEDNFPIGKINLTGPHSSGNENIKLPALACNLFIDSNLVNQHDRVLEKGTKFVVRKIVHTKMTDGILFDEKDIFYLNDGFRIECVTATHLLNKGKQSLTVGNFRAILSQSGIKMDMAK